MNGYVDAGGRALIPIRINPSNKDQLIQFEAWIDTGFTGDLVLPKSVVAQLKLVHGGTTYAELANGATVALDIYSATINLYGQDITVEVVSTDADVPLLGVGLLRDRQLTINYRDKSVIIT